jgi:hypothetical protein
VEAVEDAAGAGTNPAGQIPNTEHRSVLLETIRGHQAPFSLVGVCVALSVYTHNSSVSSVSSVNSFAFTRMAQILSLSLLLESFRRNDSKRDFVPVQWRIGSAPFKRNGHIYPWRPPGEGVSI